MSSLHCEDGKKTIKVPNSIKQRILNGYYPLKVLNQSRTPKQYFDMDCQFLTTKEGLNIIDIFNQMLSRTRIIKHLEPLCTSIVDILNKIIPNIYFGNKSNRKLFYVVVRKILTQSNHECIYLSSFWKGYEYSKIPWLRDVESDTLSKKCLLYFNEKIVDQIVKPLIAHYYYVLVSHKCHKIEFIERKKWQTFFSRNMNTLLKQKYLLPVSKTVRPKGSLRLLPKSTIDNMDFRPIINNTLIHKTKFQIKQHKEYFAVLAKKIRISSRQLFQYENLYKSWEAFIFKNKGKYLYGVKLDIKDAFGSINIKQLIDIIDSTVYLNDHDKKVIIKHIKHQYVYLPSKSKTKHQIFKWTHGLLQGDRLSSSLCELYITYQENMYLVEFKNKNCFFHRTVDDYIFCSIDAYLVHRFKLIISSVFDINETKTLMKTTKKSAFSLSYAGRNFSLDFGEISKMYSYERKFSFRYKFKIWNILKPISEKHNEIIIANTMSFHYVRHNFTMYELNTSVNSEETVLKNIFYGFLFVAYKFDTVVMALKDYNSDFSFLTDYVRNIINEFSKRIFIIVKTYRGDNFKFITYSSIIHISCNAFILVFKRRSLFYKQLIEFLGKPRNITNNISSRLELGELNVTFSAFKKMPDCFKDICMNRALS